jgi:hypothetical protein
LRQGLRADEGRCLDPPDAGREEIFKDGNFRRGRNERLDGLKSVARADFDDFNDLAHQITPSPRNDVIVVAS